jgi:hypothetical protein
MELIAKINNDDKITMQLSSIDRNFIYNQLYQNISGKLLEKLESEIKYVVGKEIGNILESAIKEPVNKMITNIHNYVSQNINQKLDSIVEQEKVRIKQIPFTIEHKKVVGVLFSYEQDAEDYLKQMYIAAGYHCRKSRGEVFSFSYNNSESGRFIETGNPPFKEYNEALKDTNGIPDLIVWNEKEAFFVEVKLSTGSVQGNQLHWYAKHPNVHSIICFVTSERKD